MSEEMSEKQAEELMREFSETKQNLHKFLKDVVTTEDTSKTGNLDMDELGYPNLPLRSSKELELFCNDVWNQQSWGNYFRRLGELHSSTSLSKEGFLMKLAVTQTKQLADITPTKKKENKGWFKKKSE